MMRWVPEDFTVERIAFVITGRGCFFRLIKLNNAPNANRVPYTLLDTPKASAVEKHFELVLLELTTRSLFHDQKTEWKMIKKEKWNNCTHYRRFQRQVKDASNSITCTKRKCVTIERPFRPGNSTAVCVQCSKVFRTGKTDLGTESIEDKMQIHTSPYNEERMIARITEGVYDLIAGFCPPNHFLCKSESSLLLISAEPGAHWIQMLRQ